jgi:hypothetical protein
MNAKNKFIMTITLGVIISFILYFWLAPTYYYEVWLTSILVNWFIIVMMCGKHISTCNPPITFLNKKFVFRKNNWLLLILLSILYYLLLIPILQIGFSHMIYNAVFQMPFVLILSIPMILRIFIALVILFLTIFKQNNFIENQPNMPS